MKKPLDFLKFGVEGYPTRMVLDNIDEADIVEAMEQYADYKVKNILNQKEKKLLISLFEWKKQQCRHSNVSYLKTFERTNDNYFKKCLNGNNSKIQIIDSVEKKLGLIFSTEP